MFQFNQIATVRYHDEHMRGGFSWSVQHTTASVRRPDNASDTAGAHSPSGGVPVPEGSAHRRVHRSLFMCMTTLACLHRASKVNTWQKILLILFYILKTFLYYIFPPFMFSLCLPLIHFGDGGVSADAIVLQHHTTDATYGRLLLQANTLVERCKPF